MPWPIRRDFTIARVERSPEGYWQANLTLDGVTIQADRKYGSWQLPVNGSDLRREVLPWFAQALEARVKPLERKERAAYA